MNFPKFILPCLIVLVAGRSDVRYSDQIDEGTVIYECSRMDSSRSNVDIAPVLMYLKFKDDFIYTEQIAGMGFVKMTTIADPQLKLFHKTIFFFDKKQSLLDSASISSKNHYFPEYSVTYPDTISIIAGCLCKKATLKFNDSTPDISVWFTDEIKCDHPNWANPYYKINGFLMDFQMKLYGLPLHYVARTVKSETIDAGIFMVSPDHQLIKDAEMDSMMSGFFR